VDYTPGVLQEWITFREVLQECVDYILSSVIETGIVCVVN